MKFLQRRWLLLLLTGLLLWLYAGTASAEPQDEKTNPLVNVKVTGVLGNYTRIGVWLPLQVEVSNQGPDIQGELRVVLGSDGRMGPAYAVDYSCSAVVPQGSTKQFNLNIPVAEMLSSVTVELVSGSSVVATGKGEFSFMGPDQLLVGLLDRTDEGLAAISQVKLTNFNPVLASLKSENFPQNAELLGLYDLLIISDVNLKLNPDQSQALAGWVARGGTLVLGGGQGWEKVIPKLPKNLPAEQVQGVENKTLTSLAAQVSAKAKELGFPAAAPLASPGAVEIALFGGVGGKALFSEEGSPLVTEYGYGSGRLVFLAFDPALEPMSSWAGSKMLWQELLMEGKTSSNLNNTSNMKIAMGSENFWGLTNALSYIPAMKLPSLQKMLWILLIYLLLAGVVNYLVLKKLDKREWTWVTVPLLAAVFVTVIYFTSFQSRPSEVMSNQISIVEGNKVSTLARVTTATGIFAPTYRNFKLQLDGEYLVKALPNSNEPMAMTLNSNQKPPAMIGVEENQGRTAVELRNMRSWTMRSFLTSADSTLSGTVEAEIIRKGDKWFAVISNNTEYDFSDGVILSNPFWFSKIGELKAGSKLETELPIGSTTSTMPGGSLVYQIYGFKGGQGPMQTPDQKEMLRQQIMEYMFNNNGVQVSASAKTVDNPIVFIGWSEQAVKGALNLSDKSIKQYFTSVFKVPVAVILDKNNLQVPPGIINGTLLESKNVGVGPPGMVYMQPNSEAVYQMQLPEGVFDEMQLNLMFAGGMKPGTNMANSWTGHMFNWQKQAWEEVKLDQGSNQIQGFGKYVSEERLFRLKIVNQEGGFEIGGVGISLGNKGGGKQ